MYLSMASHRGRQAWRHTQVNSTLKLEIAEVTRLCTAVRSIHNTSEELKMFLLCKEEVIGRLIGHSPVPRNTKDKLPLNQLNCWNPISVVSTRTLVPRE